MCRVHHLHRSGPVSNWKFSFPSSLRLIYRPINSRISIRLTQSKSMGLSSENQWNLLVFSVRYFYLFYFDSKPLRCRWWCGQSEGDIWSTNFGTATRFLYHWQTFQSNMLYVSDPKALHHILVKVSNKFFYSVYLFHISRQDQHAYEKSESALQ